MHTLEKAVNMSKPLAARVNRVQLSPTVAMTARAIALQSAGQDVISLSAGEPDLEHLSI